MNVIKLRKGETSANGPSSEQSTVAALSNSKLTSLAVRWLVAGILVSARCIVRAMG